MAEGIVGADNNLLTSSRPEDLHRIPLKQSKLHVALYCLAALDHVDKELLPAG